jgi:hypothetical protein
MWLTKDITQQFLKENGLELVVRSHEVSLCSFCCVQ